jgi:hypothetical protein
MEIRRVSAEQAGWKAPTQTKKEIEGPLYIYPVPPGFERPDPYSSEDTYERLPIPLSEGRTYVVVNSARPIV